VLLMQDSDVGKRVHTGDTWKYLMLGVAN